LALDVNWKHLICQAVVARFQNLYTFRSSALFTIRQANARMTGICEAIKRWQKCAKFAVQLIAAVGHCIQDAM
jgi:hypothetical protein